MNLFSSKNYERYASDSVCRGFWPGDRLVLIKVALLDFVANSYECMVSQPTFKSFYELGGRLNDINGAM